MDKILVIDRETINVTDLSVAEAFRKCINHFLPGFEEFENSNTAVKNAVTNLIQTYRDCFLSEPTYEDEDEEVDGELVSDHDRYLDTAESDLKEAIFKATKGQGFGKMTSGDCAARVREIMSDAAYEYNMKFGL